MASCTAKITPEGPKGSVSFSISEDNSLLSKAVLPCPDDFIVGTINSSTASVAALSGTYGTLKDKVITIATGDYITSAYNKTKEEALAGNAGRGEKRIFGESESYSVREAQVTAVSIKCEVVNSSVNIIFRESFTDAIDNGRVTVWNAESRKISFSTANEGEAFFDPEDGQTVTLLITGTRKSDNVPVSQITNISICARTAYSINLGVNSSSAPINITVDDAMLD